MPIDWASVNWVYVALLGVFALVATIVGNFLSLGHRGVAAVLSGLVFAAIFVLWSYYPHHLPLPTRLTDRMAPASAPTNAAPTPPPVPPAPVPQKPANPVTTISPPPNQ
ncbi:MAG TPA: hypothetical protein VFX37_12340 [Pseudolabrys sp.]|nr:hypothetical protein [Pseudolabrys sp.]